MRASGERWTPSGTGRCWRTWWKGGKCRGDLGGFLEMVRRWKIWRNGAKRRCDPEFRRDTVKPLQLATANERLSVLCLGAHSDDIEIGVGATLLSLMLQGVRLEVQWCVLSATGQREAEAKASADEFLVHAEMA